MESKPKPQRQRQKKREKVDVNIKVKQPKPNNVTKIKTKTGEERIVVTSTTAQERRQLRKIQKQVRKLQKKQDGPRVQDVMSTTITLGAIGGNTSGNLERSFRLWCSPVLLKPHDSEGATTPMTIRASQYDLWRVTSVRVVLQPLVGSSIVTGTVVLVDLDQEGSAAKPETVDTIKARPHISVGIGAHKTWTIPARFLAGPREGWWYCDTNEDPSQSLGPAINVRTYMKTMNVLGATNEKATTTYNGPLFLMEMHVKYQFANYNPKPALANLQTMADDHFEKGQAKFVNDTSGALLLEVSTQAALARATRYELAKSVPNTNQSKSETIWSIAGGAVEGIASALGPWGWILKGGWWVVRRIFGQTQLLTGGETDTNAYFVCYASVEDARADQPIIQTITSSRESGTIDIPAGYYYARQLNEPNLNTPTHNPVLVKSGRITPAPEPEPQPCEPEEWLPLGRLKQYSDPLPAAYTWVPQAGGGKGVIYNGLWDITGPARNARWTITGIPLLTKYQLRKTESPGDPYYLDISIKSKSGNYNTDTIRAPNENVAATANWYWADLTYTGVIFSHYLQPEKAYARQGIMHTAETLMQSMRATPDEWKEDGTFFYLDEQGLQYWHDYNYQAFQLCQEIGVDPADQNTSFTPVALFGDLSTRGFLIIDAFAEKQTSLVQTKGVCGILFPEQKWPGTNEVFNPATKSMLTATPVFQKTSYPTQKWYAMGPFETKTIRVKGTVGPPPDEDDFVRLKLEELKILADKLTDKEGKL